MAILESSHDGRRITLGARSLVGRATYALVRLHSPTASGEHARLTWLDGAWQLRDLASTNGTWLDGERVAPRDPLPLRRGARLGFGSLDDRWTLVDDAAPEAAARRLPDDERRGADGDLLILSATACVFADKDRWWLDDGSARTPVQDQQVITVDGTAYRLELPPLEVTTFPATKNLRAPRVAEAELRFSLSRDEESVALTLSTSEAVVELGQRTHHYLLHLLALEREQDRTAGTLAPGEHGWVHVDELARRVRATPEHINVAIWRARQQLRQHGFADADTLVERRPRTGQLRIGGARWTWAPAG